MKKAAVLTLALMTTLTGCSSGAGGDVVGDDGKIQVSKMNLGGEPEVDMKNTLKLNYELTYQNIEGFGTSGAWWSNEVGSWDNIDEIMDLLYDKEKGIGLNIFRYNIGGGYPTKATDPWRKSETVEVEEGVYDLERDKVAIEVFKKAVERGANHNVVFVNSPPARMTVSGFTSGGLEDKESNLAVEAEEDFAKYAVDVTELLIKEGLQVSYLSPINEPQWGWGGPNPSQEGCHYKPEQVVRVGSLVAQELDERDLGVKISLVESGEWYSSEYTLTMYNKLMDDPILKEHMDHYAVHSYWSDEASKKKTMIYFDKIDDLLPLHQTEWCQMENKIDMGMDSALVLAKTVYEDLTILNVSSWSHWLGVSKYDYKDGLIQVNVDREMYKPAKRMWTLGNYSRFIEEGAVRVDAQIENRDILATAFYNKEANETVVVAVNETDKAQEFGISSFEGLKTEVYITDEERDCVNLAEVIENGSYNLPPKSVVTFVTSHK